MLTIKDLSVKYNQIVVLKGISLVIGHKEINSLIGSNGAGKTTTLNAVSGIILPFQGRIEFNGRRIEKMEAHDIVNLGIIQVPEGRRLFPEMTVLENLEMGAYRHEEMLRSELDRVFELFTVLKERIHQVAGSLSGGEQQMLAIGRALMAKPELLMLDEPTLGLAPKVVKTVFDIIRQINSWGTTIFLVEQNAKFALEISQRAYVLESGQIVMEGPGNDLLNSDNVRKAYLGI
jgi:branched-chain amino acid transport system ATP-binding protein